MRYAKRKPRVKRSRRVVRKPTVRKISSSIKTYVKKALDNRIENKEVVMQGTDSLSTSMKIYQNFASTITTNSTAVLNPTIVQSISESGRIGNAVKVKSAYMRAVIMYNSQALDTRIPLQTGQYMVRLFIGRLKNSISAPTNGDYGQLLRAGSITYPFDSDDPLSILRSVNTEYWTIHYDKIHKLGIAGGVGNTTVGISNNDYILTKYLKINCTKMFKKTLQFVDTTINTPTNHGLYMFAGIVDSMASGNSNAQPFLLCNYDLELHYEDA